MYGGRRQKLWVANSGNEPVMRFLDERDGPNVHGDESEGLSSPPFPLRLGPSSHFSYDILPSNHWTNLRGEEASF